MTASMENWIPRYICNLHTIGERLLILLLRLLPHSWVHRWVQKEPTMKLQKEGQEETNKVQSPRPPPRLERLPF